MIRSAVIIRFDFIVTIITNMLVPMHDYVCLYMPIYAYVTCSACPIHPQQPQLRLRLLESLSAWEHSEGPFRRKTVGRCRRNVSCEFFMRIFHKNILELVISYDEIYMFVICFLDCYH